MTATALVRRIHRLDAEMAHTLLRTGELSAQRAATIRSLVDLYDGNVKQAAERLGVSRAAVYKALERRVRP